VGIYEVSSAAEPADGIVKCSTSSVSGMNPQLRSSPDEQSTTGSVEIGMIQDNQKLKQ
jgi:hypothetical protein